MQLLEYKDIEEKKEVFGNRYKNITTIEEFEYWYGGNAQNTIFRGINNASYKNYTSLQRLCITHDLVMVMDSLLFVEKEIDFLKKHNNHFLENYFKSIGLNVSDFSYLSYLQHYKDGVTQLLDFTKDKNVALYFMCEDAHFPVCGEGDMYHSGQFPISSFASIYYIREGNYLNSEQFAQILTEYISDSNKGDDYPADCAWMKDLITRIEILTVKSLKFLSKIDKKQADFPFVLEDKILKIKDGEKEYKTNFSISNPNLVAQKGCFLLYTNEDKPLEKNLYCVDIHKSLIPYIQKTHLDGNVSKEILFPDMNEIVSKAVFNSLASIYENERQG